MFEMYRLSGDLQSTFLRRWHLWEDLIIWDAHIAHLTFSLDFQSRVLEIILHFCLLLWFSHQELAANAAICSLWFQLFLL